MSLPSFVKLSLPTQQQLKHDLFLVVVTFVVAALSGSHAPDLAAGYAAVITLLKSILTTL